MPVHTRNSSQDGDLSVPGSLQSSSSVPPLSSSTVDGSQSTDVISTLVASMQNLTTADPGVQAVLSSQIVVIQTLMRNISNAESMALSICNSVHTLENKISALETSAFDHASSSALDDLEHDSTTLKTSAASSAKVKNLESEITSLKQSLPAPTKVNFHPITDVTKLKISAPSQLAYGLASKTVKLKDLHNSLMNLVFKSDQIVDIKHMYSMIRQAVDIGCSTSLLLPNIEHENEVPDFFKLLVNPPTHSFYGPILASYKCISNALLTFFIRPETVTASAPQVFRLSLK